MNIAEIIARDLLMPEGAIRYALQNARILVRRIELEKRDKSKRFVYQPDKKLKTIQYWLLKNIISFLPVHPAARAYRIGMSIKDNASCHQENKYVLKMDFTDFFPSINFTDLIPLLVDWHQKASVEWALDAKNLSIIRLSCFFREDRLPIGYPTSPAISNATMYGFDELITSLLAEGRKDFGEAVYTRYADDLTFSTSTKGACKKIETIVNKAVSEWKSPLLRINKNKTKYVSITGGSALITGIKVCSNNHITIHKKYKKKIKLLLHLMNKNQLPKNEELRLRGHLIYIRNVSPLFYNRLSIKYPRVFEGLFTNHL